MSKNEEARADAERQKELSAKLNVMASAQEERLAEQRASQLKLPYISLVIFPIDSDVLERVPKSQAVKAQAVLFYKQGDDVRLGAVNPQQPEVAIIAKKIAASIGRPPQVYVISQHSLRSALSRYRREKTAERPPQDEIRVEEKEVSEFSQVLEDLEELGQRITSRPPTEILNAIVVSAVRVRSSDVHIEPKEKNARLRFRIDGILQDITTFDREGWSLLMSRIKVLAKLKLNVHEVPQDGSFVLKLGEDTYDMRVSILPGGYGENIVVRILNRASQALAITDLGMKERDYQVVMKELTRPNGMILVTGPRGSGKTTSLASFIREVNKPELKIITLEDPIEYRLPGVEQTQVDDDAGYTFAKGLRSILRQDPDIIMVGEMRDAETAETAIHAALTGHLVFSTLHTNNAAGAVPRLVDMGMQSFVLGPALNVVIAQRLVRIVCRKCAQAYKPAAELLEQIEAVMRGVRPEIFTIKRLRDPQLKFLKAKGCPACRSTGYQGRVGAFEIFAVEGEMENLVLQGADAGLIQEAALAQGMTTVAQDAYLKVIEQITTIEEVARVSEE